MVITNVELDKIKISDKNVANKHDIRYTIGYEIESDKIIPFYIKTPKNCHSSGINRYDENSPYKMGFDVSEDKNWMKQYKAICSKIESLISQKLSSPPLNNEKYINPKLLSWDGKICTRFNRALINPEDLGYCEATGILKIGSVYLQKLNCYLQIFLKECKFKECNIQFQSMLSDTDDSGDEDQIGYDTVY